MRTTFRIDDALLSQLKARAASDGVSLTRLVNRVLRAGLSSLDRVADEPEYRGVSYAMGAPQVDLTKAAMVAAALEDEETLRKLALRK